MLSIKYNSLSHSLSVLPVCPIYSSLHPGHVITYKRFGVLQLNTLFNLFRNDDCSLLLSCDIFLPNRPAVILSAELIVVPSIFIAATPVRTSSNTFGLLLSAA